MPEQPDSTEESTYDRPSATFSTFDPGSVQPTTSPAPSRAAAPGSIGDTSGEDEDNPQPDEGPLPEFDRSVRDVFYGLMYVGALTSTFEWIDHEFVIRTLTTEELFEVALAIKPYQGTRAEQKAYQTAVVAACVVTVDDRALPAPLSTDERDTGFLNRFNYIKRNWFPPVIDEVFSRYFELEVTSNKVLEAMGNRSG